MVKPKVAIVTTSINPRPETYMEWAKAGALIVAGDLNSPKELASYVTEECGGIYLTPEMQKRWSFSELIGWNCIQRRNAAIMYAYSLREFDYILTVDDDNHPLPSAIEFVGKQVAMMGHWAGEFMSSPTGQLNTGLFCIPTFHQRGVPRGVLTNNVQIVRGTAPAEVVVVQAQVLGDPDCDAIERLVNAPDVQAVTHDVRIAPGTYAAFNSQATMWKTQYAPLMACLPGIGRYDDIFASFIFHRLARPFSACLYVGTPVVKQIRNQHDLIKDLRQEVWGLNHTLTFCDVLNTAVIPAHSDLCAAYEELMYALETVLPERTVQFGLEWAKEWKALSKRG